MNILKYKKVEFIWIRYFERLKKFLQSKTFLLQLLNIVNPKILLDLRYYYYSRTRNETKRNSIPNHDYQLETRPPLDISLRFLIIRISLRELYWRDWLPFNGGGTRKLSIETIRPASEGNVSVNPEQVYA